jgi:ubiquinol-cytochrome c reductase cytochrome c1 subunit
MMGCVKSVILAAALTFGMVGTVRADESQVPGQSWHQAGPFGTIDQAQARRGFQVYQEVCSNCHALALVSFRALQGIGFTGDQVKEIAARWPYQVDDQPNDQGKVLKRAPRPYDRIIGPFANDREAEASMGGVLPPDLSVIVKARHGGEDYITALLTGYQDPPPDGFKVMDGRFYNTDFPGHQIGMPQTLQDDTVRYSDGTRATALQEARDVAAFLSFVADPTQDQRKALGFRVILFLLVFTGLMYLCKRVVWRDAH